MKLTSNEVAEIKGFTLKSDVSRKEHDTIVQGLLTKVELFCQRIGCSKIIVHANLENNTAQQLLKFPNYKFLTAYSVLNHSTPEYVFFKELPPFYSNDPLDWFALGDWCLRHMIPGLQIKNKTKKDNACILDCYYEPLALKVIAIIIDNHARSGTAVNDTLKQHNTDTKYKLLLVYEEQDLKEGVQISRQTIISRLKKLYLNGCIEKEKEIASKIFSLRLCENVPKDYKPEGFVVDLRNENFNLIKERHNRESMFLTITAPIGKYAPIGGKLFFFVWDDPPPYGEIKGYGDIKKVTTIKKGDNFVQKIKGIAGEDLGNTLFKNEEELENYLQAKDEILVFEFNNVKLVQRGIKYLDLVSYLLGDIDTDNTSNKRILYKFFPPDEVGHTYLNDEQVRKLLEATQCGISPNIDAAINFLKGHKEINLDDYRVIGNYVLHNTELRAPLSNIVNKILSLFSKEIKDQAWKNRHNYLVHGLSRSGKSYFVEQLASMLQEKSSDVKYKKFKLSESKNTSNELDKFIEMCDKSLNAGKKVFAFVDEIDTRGKEFVYSKLFDPVGDWGKEKGLPIVWFFAGSSGRNINEFIDLQIKQGKNNKADDFFKRIPDNNKIEITPPTILDKIVAIFMMAHKRGIKYIDCGFLLFVSKTKDTTEDISTYIETKCNQKNGEVTLTINDVEAGDYNNFLESQGTGIQDIQREKNLD